MRTKKIVTWLLSIFMIAGLFLSFELSEKELVPLPFVLGTIISITLLIHYYSESQTFKKATKYGWFVLIALTVFVIICGLFNLLTSIVSMIGSILAMLFIMNTISVIVIYKKIDISILLLMAFSFVGLFFKKMHWPGSGSLIILGWAVPAILFLFIFYKRITEYEKSKNRFLNFFKNFICATITINFLGATFKVQHWPGGNLLMYIGLATSILSILILVFLLPNSNFLEWTKEHKKLFFRAFLIPLIYLSLLTSLSFVFPKTFEKLVISKSYVLENPFAIENYDIPLKEGMESSTYSGR